MRVIFMGTPDFAVPSLLGLVREGYEIAAVFTQPDKPKGRGHKLQMPPVKEAALQAGIPVYQPVTLKDPAVQEQIARLQPELILVAAYGKLLPKEVLAVPPYGCINVHGSLLPKYRGAAPIQWAVLNGEKTTGVTIMKMAEGMDTGDMLLKRETAIGENETAGELFDRLRELGAELLLQAIPAVISGALTGEKQQEAEATYAPMITREMSAIDWRLPAEQIRNRIRGLNPWPCASGVLSGKNLKIFSARVLPRSGEAGKVFEQNGSLCVFCGEQALMLEELQPENGKRMSSMSYLLGHPMRGEESFQ